MLIVCLCCVSVWWLCVLCVCRTLPHHPGLQTLVEAAGLTRLPPPLGDLTLAGHWTAVLHVAWSLTRGDREVPLSQ